MRVCRNLRIGIAALLLTAAVGCVHFQDRPLSAERVSMDFEARSLADPGLRSYLGKYAASTASGQSPTSWGLNRLTLVAFYYHPDLDVARAQLAGVRATQHTAAERPNPTLSVSPQYNATTSIPSPWIVTPSLDIPIETAGKRGYRIAQAVHWTDAARFNLAATAWRVRSRVRKHLLAIYSSNERELLLRRQEANQAESVRLLEGLVQAGEVSFFEVTQARVALNQARLARHDAEKQTATTRVQLAGSLGVPPAGLEGVMLDFSSFQQPPGKLPDAAARRQALLNRADVLAALAEYAASQSALQLEIARQYPDVHLSPGYEYDQGDNKWGIGFSLDLPVLNQNQGRIAEAEALRQEAAARFNALQARVLSEIGEAVAGYGASVDKLGTAKALNTELDRQLSAARAMLNAGEISRVDLVRREAELTAVAVAQLEASLQVQESLGTLEDALQLPADLIGALEELPRAP